MSSCYRSLDDADRSTVRFAFEMSGWAAVVVLATLVFYQFELGFPLGLLMIIAIGTMLAMTAAS